MANILKKPAPSFTTTAVISEEFKDVSLHDYRGKYLVLFFYPMDFTQVCTSEILALSDRMEEFTQRNCDVLGVSCDSHFTHLAWIQKLKRERDLVDISIPLLADKAGKVASQYEVYNAEQGVSCRAFFVIDKEQLIREMCINDCPVALSVDELLRLVVTLQNADERVQVCADETSAQDKRGLKRRMLDQEDNEVGLKTSKTAAS